MAKSKKSFDLITIIALFTSLLGFIMFFLPNFFVSDKYTSGLNMFTAMFDIENADTISYYLYFDGLKNLEPVYNALAYIIGILLFISAVCLIISAVMYCLKLFGVKVDVSIASKLAICASILMVLVLILGLIRFGQVNNSYISCSFGYAFIIGFVMAIATALIPMALKK